MPRTFIPLSPPFISRKLQLNSSQSLDVYLTVLLGAIFIGYRWNANLDAIQEEVYNAGLSKTAFNLANNYSSMKLIITGATGAAGLDVVRAAVADPAISRITVLSRKPLPATIPASEKVTQITHTDFLSYSPALLKQFKGYGACVWALGKSQNGMSEAEYTTLTHDFPVAAFKALNDAGVRGEDGTFRFVYVSGESVDQEEKSLFMFSRIKGRTEKDLIAFTKTDPTLKVHNLRPGYFFPSNPKDAAQLRSGAARILDKILGPAMFTFVPSRAIKTEDLGRFAVEAAKGTWGDKSVFQNKEMLDLLKTWRKGGDEL